MNDKDKEITAVVEGYADFLDDLKKRIEQAQVRAALAVNRELVLLYWQIGRDILNGQQSRGWGAKVLDRLAADIKKTFPHLKGFSRRNLHYMRAIAQAWPDEQFVQQLAAQIPWFHNCILLDKVKNPTEREWYIKQTVQNGWSRDILVHQIESKLYQRQGQADTNFQRTLPSPQSDLARQILKDPYNFDFLGLGEKAQERELEQALVNNIRGFLLELGSGFAFMGNQYHIVVDDQDFYIDLLFYNVKLRCYVVVDLKVADFQPEFVGKINFYLSAVDDLLRHPDDQPSVGIIMCKTKKKSIAEYALRDYSKPIGVSVYSLTEMLPDQIKANFPTIEELEAELNTTQEETDQ